MELKRDSTKNIRSVNWQGIIIVALMAFYTANFGYRVISYSFPDYGQDYLAFWSAGKIADQAGYSKIYDPQVMRSVEAGEMVKLGMIENTDAPSFSYLPTPYLSIFLVPFQILSHFKIGTSLVIWLIINGLLLAGYLIFFSRMTRGYGQNRTIKITPFLLVMFSYPVFDNFIEGQLNVFLMICVGEFVRYACKGNPLISGMFLGGLLLKPQLLVIIIPLLLFMGYWKSIKGFLSTAIPILVSSWWLSGTDGMRQLWSLLTGFTEIKAAVSPQYMINWRMVGILINDWSSSSIGWVITGLGMVATILAVVFLARNKTKYGDANWQMFILGVFSATLAFTWHAHNHMAMVLIPVLLMNVISGNLPQRILIIWNLLPPLAWLTAGLAMVILQEYTHLAAIDLVGLAIPVSGFVTNLVILVTVIRRYVSDQDKKDSFDTEQMGKKDF
jgi:hypothetical protein